MSYNIDLGCSIIIPKVGCEDEEIRENVFDRYRLPCFGIKDTETDTWRRRDGTSVFITKTAHASANWLLDDVEKVDFVVVGEAIVLLVGSWRAYLHIHVCVGWDAARVAV
jgi:hypothetical protein